VGRGGSWWVMASNRPPHALGAPPTALIGRRRELGARPWSAIAPPLPSMLLRAIRLLSVADRNARICFVVRARPISAETLPCACTYGTMTQASLEHGLRPDAVAFFTSFVRRIPKQPREQKHLNAHPSVSCCSRLVAELSSPSMQQQRGRPLSTFRRASTRRQENSTGPIIGCGTVSRWLFVPGATHKLSREYHPPRRHIQIYQPVATLPQRQIGRSNTTPMCQASSSPLHTSV
jgi:hypothetical protein